MAKIITITNGSGTGNVATGTYQVTADAVGYDNTTINPSSVTVDSLTNDYSFTIGATGTLTLHVSEDGTAEGTPIVGATFVRTDSTGTQYGDAIITDESGNAVFNNVPFAETSAPNIYYKQTASDGSHEFDDSVQSTTMTTDASTIEVTNTLAALRTINLTDANYAGLPIDTATLTLE